MSGIFVLLAVLIASVLALVFVITMAIKVIVNGLRELPLEPKAKRADKPAKYVKPKFAPVVEPVIEPVEFVAPVMPEPMPAVEVAPDAAAGAVAASVALEPDAAEVPVEPVAAEAAAATQVKPLEQLDSTEKLLELEQTLEVYLAGRRTTSGETSVTADESAKQAEEPAGEAASIDDLSAELKSVIDLIMEKKSPDGEDVIAEESPPLAEPPASAETAVTPVPGVTAEPEDKSKPATKKAKPAGKIDSKQAKKQLGKLVANKKKLLGK